MSAPRLCLLLVTAFAHSVVTVAAQTANRDAADPLGRATISGRVIDPVTASPIRKAVVRAVDREALPKGRVTLTDANGHYELTMLPAGHYTVSAKKAAYLAASYGQTAPLDEGDQVSVGDGSTVEHIDLTLSRGAVVAGMITDDEGDPLAGVKVSVLRRLFLSTGTSSLREVASRSTNSIGEFRVFGIPPGQYYLSATRPGFEYDTTSNQPAFVPTYFPGTPNVAEAQRLSIAPSQVLAGMKMALASVRGVQVSGTALDGSGRPLTGGVGLDGAETRIMSSIRPDGTFTLINVPPGDYTLRADRGVPTDDRASMTLTVDANGRDVRDLLLVTVTRSTLTGRVVSDGTTTAALQPAAVHIQVWSARPNDGSGLGVTVHNDLTFQFADWPGRVLIGARSDTPGWVVKQVRLNGQDITERGVDIGVDRLSGLEIEMTNVTADVSGRVSDSRGAPTRHATIVVFAQDRERWRLAARYAPNPNIVATRPDANSGYDVPGLRPGAYYAAAVDADGVEPDEWNDPAFLERIREQATPFVVGPAERRTLHLSVIEQPR